MAQMERDLPLGHPSAPDTVLGSPEHKRWLVAQEAKSNAVDFPTGHPKRFDTPGSMSTVQWQPGVDPAHPELEAFTGRTPEQVNAIAEYNRQRSAAQEPTPAHIPVDARKANKALAAKRAELGVDTLTAEETQAVLDSL
jgi:hypothetical protein